MKILVERIFKGDKYTIGKLYLDGKYLCDTLEDPIRSLPKTCPNTVKSINCTCKGKINGDTAIPAGEYKVILSHSPRFGKILPEILDVPHFLGIRIHSGNSSEDSSGCLLVGTNSVKGKVLNSKDAYNKLIKLLETDKDNLTIKIQ